MKKLLIALFIAVYTLPAIADETLSDERLVDMVAGPETIELQMNAQKSSGDRTPLFSVAAVKNGFLYTYLPTHDYEAKLVESKRAVIFTHKHTTSRIILVRTRYTGEKSLVWSVLFVPKDAPRSGRASIAYYTIGDNDNGRLNGLLRSIVP